MEIMDCMGPEKVHPYAPAQKSMQGHHYRITELLFRTVSRIHFHPLVTANGTYIQIARVLGR